MHKGLKNSLDAFGVAVHMLVVATMYTCKKTGGDLDATRRELQNLLGHIYNGLDDFAL